MARLSTGEFLAKLRREKGFTQQEVADRLDVSNRTVSAWEKNKAMPDVLLLPAITELYGVTVDEILAGVRKEGDSEIPTFSPKTEKSILIKKLSRFTMQSYILLGISILGQLFIFVGWLNDKLTFTARDEFNWWRFAMYLSVVIVIADVAVLFALWKSAESSVDSSLKGSNGFYLSLFLRVVFHFYVAAGLEFLFGFALTVLCAIGFRFFLMCSIYAVVAAALLLLGTLLYNHKVNVLEENVSSKIKQSHTITLFYMIAAYLYMLEVLTAFAITKEGVNTTFLVVLCSVLSVALLLIGTILFNCKLSAASSENKAFLVKKSFNIAIFFYVAAGLYFTVAITSLISNFHSAAKLAFFFTHFILSFTALLLGSLLHRRNLINWLGEEMIALIKRNCKLYLKVFLWGLIPFFGGAFIVGLDILLAQFASISYVLSEILLLCGAIVILLDIAVCFAICFAKRERVTVKQ